MKTSVPRSIQSGYGGLRKSTGALWYDHVPQLQVAGLISWVSIDSALDESGLTIDIYK